MTAMATILICVALIAVGSYALFSDTTKVTNHLQAGELDIKLWRIDLSGTDMDDDGYMAAISDTDDKDFTDATANNIFDIEDKYIVPQSTYTAEMMISRTATTNVAIKYWLDFAVPTVTDPEDVALLNQITITVQVYDRATSAYVNTAINGVHLADLNKVSATNGQTHYNIGSIADPIDNVAITDSVTSANIDSDTLATDEEAIALFKVIVEFDDNLDENAVIDGDGNLVDNDANPNNAAKNGQISFDLIVNAVQATEA